VRNAIVIAANQSFDSSRRMRSAINDGSKLCAEVPRHAGSFLAEILPAQLAKGRSFAPPRLIPTGAAFAAMETLPVSMPSGLRGSDAARRSMAVRP